MGSKLNSTFKHTKQRSYTNLTYSNNTHCPAQLSHRLLPQAWAEVSETPGSQVSHRHYGKHQRCSVKPPPVYTGARPPSRSSTSSHTPLHRHTHVHARTHTLSQPKATAKQYPHNPKLESAEVMDLRRNLKLLKGLFTCLIGWGQQRGQKQKV